MAPHRSSERALPEGPETFTRAVAALRSVRMRPELVLEEVPAPGRIAPFAVALSGDVLLGDAEVATGRFVLLHDPAGHDAWEGTFRAVTFVRATMEPELGADPVLGEVGWAWLTESLQSSGATAIAVGGTVTRVVSQSYGALADRPPTVELEVRASWTPVAGGTAIAAHLRAWGALLCALGGLPPLPEGVAALPLRR